MDRDRFGRLFDMTGRTVVVTGGTRGIGLSLAEGYICAGANVVVASRKPDACEAAVRRLESLGGHALGVPTHLGELDSLSHLVDETVRRFGGVDVVVNNAANALAQPVGEQTSEAWDKSFGVNLRGPVFLVQAALEHLAASPHAAVLNMISIGAFGFASYTSIYSAGKAALLSFTRSMADAYADRGIRVNALAPGGVDTDMMRKNPPEFIDALASRSLLKRVAEPDEMVGTALLLTSDAGSYITGQVFLVDGGTTPH